MNKFGFSGYKVVSITKTLKDISGPMPMQFNDYVVKSSPLR